ncbi:hypothetical protein SCHPADRAFT_198679 [Schizopora paradoxa]|uniref:Uncharacterized protein n=1 Tax=Schizopora paradoxa TaxID=27342 RepID=A0A0H2RYR0_9AGAM|nr:hypothetical protein SCHPADRAFT_198679 [Schizopora paradoxa]
MKDIDEGGQPPTFPPAANAVRPAQWPVPDPTLAKLYRWIVHVERFLTEMSIQNGNWSGYVLEHFVSDTVRQAVERIRLIVSMKTDSIVRWTWSLLKAALEGAQEQIENASWWAVMKDVRKKNKLAFTVVETSLATVGTICMAPAAIVGGLGLIGFSSAGVVGGSLAAGIQSSIGLVRAGSAFAVAQSITTSSAFLAAASGSAFVGAGALTASAIIAYDEKAPPSVTWDDGEMFQPEPDLLERLARRV